MNDKLFLEKILFLDIETVPVNKDFNDLPEDYKAFWEKKSSYFRSENQTSEEVFNRAGIYAEFGKIVCISFGLIYQKESKRFVRIKSFSGDDEKLILIDFANLLKRMSANDEINLCAHNGKEFDFPYISRRMLINNIPLPDILDVCGKKPWETCFLDTMEMWKFGDHKHYTSLNLLTYLFGIPSPKNDIDGSMVNTVYWIEHDIQRIAKYCQKDVLAVVQLFLKFKGEPLIDDENIEFVE
jgi:predicted PolB exonuclease-like 3'-5' exonuclease